MSGEQIRIVLEPAFVLHRRPYRDSSALLEMFDTEHGRFGLIAKGLKGKKNTRQAILQPFTPLLVSWTARGELGTLIDAEADGAALQLSGQVLLSGFYLNELLMHLLHRNDPHPALFDYYRYTLQRLRELPSEPEGAVVLQQHLRLFEKYLLQEVGYGLVLDCDAGGTGLQPDRFYRYVIDQGPVPVGSVKTVNDSWVFAGSSLSAFAEEEFKDAASLRDAKRLTRQLLDHYLGGKQLNSRKLLIELQRTSDAVAGHSALPNGEEGS